MIRCTTISLGKTRSCIPASPPFQDPSVVVCGTGIVLTHGGHLGGGWIVAAAVCCAESSQLRELSAFLVLLGQCKVGTLGAVDT